MRSHHRFLIALLPLALNFASLAAQDKIVAVGKDPVKREGKVEEDSPKAKITIFGGKEIELPAQTHEFKLKAGKRYRISMTSKDIDSVLAVTDSAGHQLALDDDSGAGANGVDALLTVDILKDATYKIHAASLKGFGKYNLEVSDVGNVKINEVGKGFKAEGKIGPALSVTYTVKLQEGKTYVIDMVTDDPKSLDPFLRLRDANGKQLAEDDDSGGNLNARISFRAQTTGSYQIVATSFGPTPGGSFTLTVREEKE